MVNVTVTEKDAVAISFGEKYNAESISKKREYGLIFT